MVLLSIVTLLLTAQLATMAPAPAPQGPAAQCDVAGARLTVERFRALNSAGQLLTEEGKSLLTGELADNAHAAWGSQPPADALHCTVAGGAVARIPSRRGSRDGYLYLQRSAEGAWSIFAARALALPGFVQVLVDRLKNKPDRTADEEHLRRQFLLVMSSDAELAAWARRHAGDLDRLRVLAPNGGGMSRRVSPERHGSAEVEEILARLHLTSAEAVGGVTKIVAGGMIDNSVGFFHTADPALLPPISPSDFIWIEPLGGGWYLFKTT